MALTYTGFDHREQQIVALQKMTRKDLLDAYRNVLLQKQHRELLLVSPGKAGIKDLLDDPDIKYSRVDNTDVLKASLPSFSVQ